MASDNLHHDKYSAKVFLKAALQHLDTTIHRFRKIVIFSDSSDKSVQAMFHSPKHHVARTKHSVKFLYHEPRKGPEDGIGGTTTRRVSSEVMSGKEDEATSRDFAKVDARKRQNHDFISNKLDFFD